MTTALQFAVFGLGIGAVFALLAQGLVVTYSGSGVLNFAHGAMAMLGAYGFWQLRHEEKWAFMPSFAVAVGAVTLIGVAVYQLVMRPLKTASSLARVVATLGILVTAQGAATLIWGLNPKGLNSEFPQKSFTVGDVVVPVDRLYLVGIAAGLTALLWAAYRYTPIGLAIRAASQNPRAAASIGWSPDRLATATWAVGAALAAVAGVLIAPLTSISVDEMPLLVVPVMAAALIGGFTSLVLTFAGAIAIGIAQSEIQAWVHLQGATWSVPFVLIVLLLVVRGKGVPVRGYFAERLPTLGDGVVRWRYVVPAVVVFGYLLTVFPVRLLDGLTISMAWAILMLSVVVLLGYTSQLSFEQMAMAGLATLIAARLVADLHWPFEAAFLTAVAAAVPIGIVFAGPALRTRGVNLAVVTLGMGMVVTYMILTNNTFTGGFEGISIGPQRLFGIDIDTVKYPERYALLVFGLFVVCCLAVANVRRGRSGSALVAVRTNERAAAALGINVFTTKLFAFVLGSTLAAVGGLLYGFRSQYIQFDEFAPFQSVLVVSYAIIGGVALLLGPVVAAGFVAGGFGGWLLKQFVDTNDATQWLVLLGGISLVLFVVLHPDGIASVQARQFAWLEARLRRLLGRERPPAPEPLPEARRTRVTPATLQVSALTVRFGGVTAVDDVSLTVGPGEVVGLIGPNGAGKTTLIDAVTGFVRPASGEVRLRGERIESWPAHRRARFGLSRSFQSLELFEDSTVRENLRVASDRRELHAYFGDIVRSAHRPLSPAAAAAVREFALEGELDHRVSDLPYSHRRLVAIARAIAVTPSILLLDEPASGLSGPESRELVVVVRRLAAEWGLGVLLIEHDMAFVMNVCDRIHVLDFGRAIAAGRPEEIRTDPTVVSAYLGEAAAAEVVVAGTDPGREPTY